MNPNNEPSTKKSSKKSKQPSTSTSVSSKISTTARTRVRKPFHQIYLEEIARKGITARAKLEVPTSEATLTKGIKARTKSEVPTSEATLAKGIKARSKSEVPISEATLTKEIKARTKSEVPISEATLTKEIKARTKSEVPISEATRTNVTHTNVGPESEISNLSLKNVRSETQIGQSSRSHVSLGASHPWIERYKDEHLASASRDTEDYSSTFIPLISSENATTSYPPEFPKELLKLKSKPKPPPDVSYLREQVALFFKEHAKVKRRRSKIEYKPQLSSIEEEEREQSCNSETSFSIDIDLSKKFKQISLSDDDKKVVPKVQKVPRSKRKLSLKSYDIKPAIPITESQPSPHTESKPSTISSDSKSLYTRTVSCTVSTEKGAESKPIVSGKESTCTRTVSCSVSTKKGERLTNTNAQAKPSDSEKKRIKKKFDSPSLKSASHRVSKLKAKPSDSEKERIKKKFDSPSLKSAAQRVSELKAKPSDSEKESIKKKFDSPSLKSAAHRVSELKAKPSDSEKESIKKKFDSPSLKSAAHSVSELKAKPSDSEKESTKKIFGSPSLKSSAHSVSELSSFYESLKPSKPVDIFKPLKIPSYVKKPSKSIAKSPPKVGRNTESNKPSTSKNVKETAKESPLKNREYYMELGAIKKNLFSSTEPDSKAQGDKDKTEKKSSYMLSELQFEEPEKIQPSKFPLESLEESIDSKTNVPSTSSPHHSFHHHDKDPYSEPDHIKNQCGESSSPEFSSPSDNKSSKYEDKSLQSEAKSEEEDLNLEAFKEDLGEAILDSIFFGNDDDYDEYDYYEDEEYEDEDELEDDDYDYESTGNDEVAPENITFSISCGQGGGTDSPDLEFVYDDTDTHGNEIAELYSYTEQPELQLNVKAFEDQMESYNLPPSWQCLSVEKRKSVILKLLDQLEVSKKPLRMRSARCLLYIAQGCWAEMQSDTEQQHWARINCMLLYQLGAFSAFTDLLNIEIENSTAAHVAMRKIAVSLADSQDLRVILSVLYTVTEVIRNEKATENSEYKNYIEDFCYEIGNADGDDLLVIKLLGMVTRFCSGAAPHFPMKKVLLLLWKLILVSLGGMSTLKELKAEKRKRAGLPAQDEDTMEIAKTMRSSSPPASASDLLEAQNQKRNTRPFRRSLMKQSSLDDQESLGMEMETTMGNDNGEDLADMTEYDERRPSDNTETSQMYNNHNINMYNRQLSPPPQHDILPRGLPWQPKVRQKDIDLFLDGARLKFLGYSLPGDQATLFGLPEPIHEGVKILKEHKYTSLAELQIQKEEEIARNPLSTEEDEIELTPAEILYQAMLPNLPQYMIALLKILLAAAPTSKAKTDSINIMADVLPEEMPMTVLQSMKLGIDVNRHKEIIVKAVSAILLLLLKHFKLNHIYQFEFMSQHLVFANCIPLVLKFFNQNIMAYVGAKNVIPILDFPSCVIGDQPELTAESLEIGDAASFSWRNMFSCINLLRILNKLTKWKHSRIMMLVVFKSAPILKRTLKVRHAMTQLYVLKLLKMQTKYLGRQWRKSNMKTISAIYQKVRHRLNDDWAYGNDLDARPWDFQAEECALRASVDRFNNRRYTLVNESEFEPVDNCLSSVLGTTHELSESFKTHYNLWLEQEVFGAPIEWEKLLLEDNYQ